MISLVKDSRHMRYHLRGLIQLQMMYSLVNISFEKSVDRVEQESRKYIKLFSDERHEVFCDFFFPTTKDSFSVMLQSRKVLKS